jgi:hypothetical protein
MFLAVSFIIKLSTKIYGIYQRFDEVVSSLLSLNQPLKNHNKITQVKIRLHKYP